MQQTAQLDTYNHNLYENASEDGNVRGLLLNLVFNKTIRVSEAK